MEMESNSTAEMEAFQANPGGRQGNSPDGRRQRENLRCLQETSHGHTDFQNHINRGHHLHRALLKKIATIFDSLRFAATLTVNAKLKMKLLNTRGIDWDERIQTTKEECRKKWVRRVPSLGNLSIP